MALKSARKWENEYKKPLQSPGGLTLSLKPWFAGVWFFKQDWLFAVEKCGRSPAN